jgi:hypothetical protein
MLMTNRVDFATLSSTSLLKRLRARMCSFSSVAGDRELVYEQVVYKQRVGLMSISFFLFNNRINSNSGFFSCRFFGSSNTIFIIYHDARM